MRQIREILRLLYEQHESLRRINQRLAISHVAVKKVSHPAIYDLGIL